MAQFRSKEKKTPPAISTQSLPDIIFMLIFFFMVSTTMRESTLLVKKPHLPRATEHVTLEKKSLVSNIYISAPSLQYQKLYGTQPVIQLNEAIEDVSKIAKFVELEKESMPANDRSQMIVSLKVDSKAKMGIVTDVKQELRKANALKISYSVVPKN
ncbi:MAG: biopolymer transporter ExbD [Bacteroidales bacterium]|jgi:biopolymer transport protein ExbD|nr:biopolymer transporter ExbD [Bacteroidales bacterium]MBQ3677603.1 biopolymer transporter ExbD [Bacteroidales bacterium]MBR4497464.1 biopolymer transporter ExbD [Bacteroidales bacterium]MBR4690477.1 biopolymer transporter ExbD [Bacteroidales bacterium]MBR7034425.1 biopolymer transporter ExbD [Bacteroidales bacterium]